MRPFVDDLVEAREAPLRRMRELRDLGGPARGFPDEFYRLAAYLVRGKEHPGNALAEMLEVDKSTASRWLGKAEAKGFLSRNRKPRRDFWDMVHGGTH